MEPMKELSGVTYRGSMITVTQAECTVLGLNEMNDLQYLQSRHRVIPLI